MKNKEWKLFKYKHLFDIKKGKRLTKEGMIKGNIPYIGAIENNNGYRNFIECDKKYLHEGNTITINYNGSVGKSFYQPHPFWASDDCNVLYSKNINKYTALFLIPLIEKERYRFNYGRKWKKEIMLESYINLPINSNGTPDWQFMEYYIKTKYINKPSKKSFHEKQIKLDDKKWEVFTYEMLFDIQKGERLTKRNRRKGNIPLITATSNNNGIAEYIDYNSFENKKVIFENKITIDMFFNSFYHNYKYFSDDNVHTLINKHENNKYINLFIVNLLHKELFRFAYGRQVRLSRLKNYKIKLPVDKQENPDWQFMEDYIKSLPYSSNL